MEITVGDDSMPEDFSPYTGGVIHDSSELCLVCLTNECEGENKEIWHKYILKCGHPIHTRCCRKWWAYKNIPSCPYCGDIKMIKELADKFGIGFGKVSESDLKKLVEKSKE